MSYANLRDMLGERGISVNRSTIYRWFIEYSLYYVRSCVVINLFT